MIRNERSWQRFKRDFGSGDVWLSSVVLMELYAGTGSLEDALDLDQLTRIMERTGRILQPAHGDWIRCGRLLERRSRLHGQVKTSDHLADLLILVSAAGIGGTVVTANLRHFEPWARLARATRLDVEVVQDAT